MNEKNFGARRPSDLQGLDSQRTKSGMGGTGVAGDQTPGEGEDFGRALLPSAGHVNRWLGSYWAWRIWRRRWPTSGGGGKEVGQYSFK